MTQEALILSELQETRRELTQVKALLLAMSGKKAKKQAPPRKKRTVEDFKKELINQHQKKQLK